MDTRATFASSVCLTRDYPLYDILVVDPSNIVRVYVGCHQLVNVDPGSAVASGSRITGLESVFRFRFHLKVASATRVTCQRAMLDLRPCTPLVRDCIDALSYALDQEDFLRLWSLFSAERSICEADTKEFDAFCRILLSALVPSFFEPKRAEVRSSPSDEDWEFVLSSELHRLCQNDPVVQKLQKDLVWRPPKDNHSFHKRLLADEAVRLSRAQLALHLLFEDWRLRADDVESASRLASFLSKTARWLGWDVYYRHYAALFPLDNSEGDMSSDSGIKQEKLCLPTAFCSPPNIYEALLGLLTGNLVHYPLPDDLRRHYGVARYFHAEQCCLVSRQLGQFFSILWQTKDPVRVVLEMVKEKFDLEALNRLAFAVAQPLREALNACRHRPESSWPVDVYPLIGREDLFAMASKADVPHRPKGLSKLVRRDSFFDCMLADYLLSRRRNLLKMP